MNWIEKVTDRIIYGNDSEWNMNIHKFDWVPGVGLYGIWTAYKKLTRRNIWIFFWIGQTGILERRISWKRYCKLDLSGIEGSV